MTVKPLAQRPAAPSGRQPHASRPLLHPPGQRATCPCLAPGWPVSSGRAVPSHTQPSTQFSSAWSRDLCQARPPHAGVTPPPATAAASSRVRPTLNPGQPHTPTWGELPRIQVRTAHVPLDIGVPVTPWGAGPGHFLPLPPGLLKGQAGWVLLGAEAVALQIFIIFTRFYILKQIKRKPPMNCHQ